MDFFKIACTDTEREDARRVINLAFRAKQRVALEDRDAILLEERDQELSGSSRELIVLSEGNTGDLIRGVVVLTLGQGAQADLADVRYLSVDPVFFGKRLGIDLIKHAEHRAKTVYQRKRMCLTTVYHPTHPQEGLEKWYLQLGYRHIKDKDFEPTAETKLKWFKREFHKELRFKHFEKDL